MNFYRIATYLFVNNCLVACRNVEPLPLSKHTIQAHIYTYICSDFTSLFSFQGVTLTMSASYKALRVCARTYKGTF